MKFTFTNSLRRLLLLSTAVCMALALTSCVGKKDIVEVGQEEQLDKTAQMETLSFVDMSGNEVPLGKVIGEKPVVLTFFASWCKACVEEVPENNKIFKEYAEKGLLVMYGVNFGDPKNAIEKMISSKNIQYPVLIDESKRSQKLFEVLGLPMNVVIDKNGTEIYRGSVPPPEDVLARVVME